MPNLNKTEIVMVMDATGSMMGSRHTEAVNGYNEFIQQQKNIPGDCAITLVKFNSTIGVMSIYDSKPIQQVETLSYFCCDGMTDLNDAIGKSIVNLGKKLEAMPEDQRPGKVIMVILTDGEENSSKEYSYQQIKDMMEHQRTKYNWQFLVMGSADINASPDGKFAGLASVSGTHGARGITGDLGNGG